MAAPADLLQRIEASLTDPFLTPGEARERAEAWIAQGVKTIFTYPWLLGELGAESRSGVHWVGAVGFPSGGATLSTKRMELLECVRLGAGAATVVLTPGYVLGGCLEALEKEVNALLTTAHELQIRFLVEARRLTDAPLTMLARVLREARPYAVVTGGGQWGSEADPEDVRRLRGRIPKKVRIIAGGDVSNPATAHALLAAGAECFLTSRPEAVLASVG